MKNNPFTNSSHPAQVELPISPPPAVREKLGWPPFSSLPTGEVAILLFLIQGLTAVMSSYATKTWPLVMVLLILWGLSSAADQHKQASPS